ncbi:MAG: BRCT domain-containing protein [Lachnospiraceae bacterium]|nr:BRCT domain-containing protein [Lachnospiraceae bacterium]
MIWKQRDVVVTGDFDFGSRQDVYSFIENAGGIIDNNVKKATDFVVVGCKGSDAWKTGNYGGKIQKAIELKDKGEHIEIVKENDFIEAVKHIMEVGEPEITEKSKQINTMMGDNYDWKLKIRNMLEDLIREYELPAGSLYLSDNYSQSGINAGKLISHSVCIWEPDYPPMPGEKPGQNKKVVTIGLSTVKSRPDDLDMNIRELQEADLHQYFPDDAVLVSNSKNSTDEEKDEKGNIQRTVKVRFNSKSQTLCEYIRKNTEYCLAGYESKAARFGCCSKFIECSDARKCVHANKLYNKACIYRDSLDDGRIFYGRNKNI